MHYNMTWVLKWKDYAMPLNPKPHLWHMILRHYHQDNFLFTLYLLNWSRFCDTKQVFLRAMQTGQTKIIRATNLILECHSWVSIFLFLPLKDSQPKQPKCVSIEHKQALVIWEAISCMLVRWLTDMPFNFGRPSVGSVLLFQNYGTLV